MTFGYAKQVSNDHSHKWVNKINPQSIQSAAPLPSTSASSSHQVPDSANRKRRRPQETQRMPGAWVDEDDDGSITSSQQRKCALKTLPTINDKGQIRIAEFRSTDLYVRPSRSKHKRPRTAPGRQSVSEDGLDGIYEYELKSDPIEVGSINSSVEEITAMDSRKDLQKDMAKAQKPSPATDISPPARNKTELQVLISQTLDGAERKRKGLAGLEGSAKRLRRRSSPDPLTADQTLENNRGGADRSRAPAAKTRPVSQSLSQRGSIHRTTFSRTTDKNTAGMAEQAPPDDERDAAAKVIGQHFEVLAGVSGKFKFEIPENESSARKCYLQLQAVSTVIQPSDETGLPMEGYEYLGVNLQNIREVSLSEPISSIIDIKRCLTSSCPPHLTLRLVSPSQVENFKKWVCMKRFQQPSIKLLTVAPLTLESRLQKALREASQARPLLDKDVPDDIKCLEVNQRRRRSVVEVPSSLDAGRTRLRDSMRGPADEMPPKGCREGERRLGPSARTRSQPPRGASSADVSRHKEPSPEPVKWTEQNENWDKDWRMSLVYLRVTVDRNDMLRLDEGEYLNDNLITFYLRYMQDELERTRPDLAKRIYFHNTFFFQSLKPSKGSRGINYNSVRSWTSKVDLFTKDFIVVPINEHSHWYVAIICNAPKLIPHPKENNESKMAVQPPVEEVPKPTPPTTPDRCRGTSEIVQSNGHHQAKNVDETVVGIQGSFKQMSIESDSPNPTTEAGPVPGTPPRTVAGTSTQQPSSSGISSTKSKKKAAGPGPRKYEPDQPRIITLDSLDLAHSPACALLRDYLVAELKDKKGMEIDNPGRLGMTAKDLPQQENYCDCGVFLLGYVRQFLQDPDHFVRSTLQHERIAWDLNPSDLRNEMRDLIFRLQKAYQGQKKAAKAAKTAKQKEAKDNAQVSEAAGPKRGSSAPVTEGALLSVKEPIVDEHVLQVADSQPKIRAASVPPQPDVTEGKSHIAMPSGPIVGNSSQIAHPNTAAADDILTTEQRFVSPLLDSPAPQLIPVSIEQESVEHVSPKVKGEQRLREPAVQTNKQNSQFSEAQFVPKLAASPTKPLEATPLSPRRSGRKSGSRAQPIDIQETEERKQSNLLAVKDRPVGSEVSPFFVKSSLNRNPDSHPHHREERVTKAILASDPIEIVD